MSRILLCEKNEVFRTELLRVIQCRFPHVNIKWIHSGEECLAATGDFRPDILILGANLYTGGEMDLIDQLRKKHPGARIILFTNYDIEEYRNEAALRGADHTISKEIWTGNQILALIDSILTANPEVADKPPGNPPMEGKGLPGASRREGENS